MASGGAEPPRGDGAPHGAAGHVKLEHAPGGSQAQVLQLLSSAEGVLLHPRWPGAPSTTLVRTAGELEAYLRTHCPADARLEVVLPPAPPPAAHAAAIAALAGSAGPHTGSPATAGGSRAKRPRAPDHGAAGGGLAAAPVKTEADAPLPLPAVAAAPAPAARGSRRSEQGGPSGAPAPPPLHAAGAAAAQPSAAEAGHFVIARLAHLKLSPQGLLDNLQPHDVVFCVGRVRLATEALEIKVPHTTFRRNDAGDAFELLPPFSGGATLFISADWVTLLNLDIHGTAIVQRLYGWHIVNISDSVKHFVVRNSRLYGAGTPVYNRRIDKWVGNIGVRIGKNCKDLLFERVKIYSTSGNSVHVNLGSEATFQHVEIYDSKKAGVMLDGSFSCTLEDCIVLRSADEAYCIDAWAQCVMLRCVGNDRKVEAIAVDFPVTLFSGNPPPGHGLLSKPHIVRDCVFDNNGEHGAVVHRGVGVDFTGTKLRGNAWCGLRVEPDVMPGSTAGINLSRTQITGNGFAPDANGPMAETFGVVMETAASTGLSRASEVIGRDMMVMHGNRGGIWGEWTDPAK